MNLFYAFLLSIGIRDLRTLRIILRLVALVGGITAAFYVSMLMEQGEFGWAGFLLIPVLLIAILDFVVVDVIADKAFPIAIGQKLVQMERRLGADAIQAIAQRLELAISQFPACDQSRISSTVHLVVKLPANSEMRDRVGLLQLTDYVGPDGGQKGRVIPVTKGVIGRCARSQDLEYVDFADDSEYHERMVKEFGFTKPETERHTQTARSYLAYPLKKDDESFVGVLYFFTTEPQVFPAVAKVDNLNDVSREVVSVLSLARLV